MRGAYAGSIVIQYGTQAERLALVVDSIVPFTEFKETDTGNYYKFYGTWVKL